ncbi:hypothetical protein BS78_06G041200 [Paspalum vaginatum]|nr:hypothetical protein BS78_06G041200 [Paspalum vaginatum]
MVAMACLLCSSRLPCRTRPPRGHGTTVTPPRRNHPLCLTMTTLAASMPWPCGSSSATSVVALSLFLAAAHPNSHPLAPVASHSLPEEEHLLACGTLERHNTKKRWGRVYPPQPTCAPPILPQHQPSLGHTMERSERGHRTGTKCPAATHPMSEQVAVMGAGCCAGKRAAAVSAA